MADPEELVVPFDVAPKEEPVTTDTLVVPFDLGPPDDDDDDTLESEKVFSALANLDAGIALASSVVAPVFAGYADIAGSTIGSIAPGGETGTQKGERWHNAVQGALTYEPKTELGEGLVDTAGAGMEKIGQGAKFIGSGYAGLGAMAAGADNADANLAIQDFKDTPNAIAEGAYQITDNPWVAAVASIAPEIAALGFIKPRLPRGGPGAKVKNIDVDTKPGMDVPEGYGGTGPAEAGWRSAGGQQVSTAEFAQLKAAVAAKDAEAVARIVNANPAIVAAFDELGISYAPQMVSRSESVRSTASGLKSATGSELAAIDEIVGRQLKAAADDLVNRYGSTDRMQVEAGVREAFDTDIGRLNTQIEALYDDVLNNIPQAGRVNATEMRQYIRNRIEQLGGGDIAEGLENASKHERALWNLTHRRRQRSQTDEASGESRVESEWEANEPSYAAIDSYRRDVGEGLNGTGVYGNNKVGELRNTYGYLARTQQAAAESVGPEVGAAYRAANEAGETLAAARASSLSVLGRNLEAGMIPKVDSAATALIKGNGSPFEKLINAIPEGQRQAVAMSVMDRIMLGTGKSDQIADAFLGNMRLLRRNSSARTLLFRYLPDEAVRRYKVIEEASEGFLYSKIKDNRSNTANAMSVIKAWEDGSLWSRLFSSKLAKWPGVGDWITKLTKAGPANRVAAAEKFLTSPALDNAARLYAAEKVAEANKLAMRSAAYNRWMATLDQTTRNTVQKDGVMAFLFAASTEGQ